MSNRPGFKHTPLGWIPDEWEVKGFYDCFSIRNGQVDPKLEKYKNKILIAPNHIESGTGRILYIETACEQNAISGKYLVQKGDIIYSKIRPYLRKAAISPFECLCSADMYALTANTNFELSYGLNIVLSNRFTQLVNNVSGRTGIPKVNREELTSIVFPVPTIKEQRKIATILSIWDEAITKTQQLIAHLKQRNSGLMQKLLQPKADWKEYRIGELLKKVKRPIEWNDEELYHLISVRRRSGGAFFRESLYGKQILTKNLFTAEEGDFLISKMQIVHGASAVVPSELSGMKISGSYLAVHANNDEILDINFFNWLSKTKWFYRLTYVSSYGVHIEKMTFDFEDFNRHRIKLPSNIGEQKQIVGVLQKAFDEVKLYDQKISALQLQKKGLMQKLLTGEVRVKI